LLKTVQNFFPTYHQSYQQSFYKMVFLLTLCFLSKKIILKRIFAKK